jgi:hypothetical protein
MFLLNTVETECVVMIFNFARYVYAILFFLRDIAPNLGIKSPVMHNLGLIVGRFQ